MSDNDSYGVTSFESPKKGVDNIDRAQNATFKLDFTNEKPIGEDAENERREALKAFSKSVIAP